MGIVMALYVASCVYHVVDASALSTCIVLRAFVVYNNNNKIFFIALISCNRLCSAP